MLCQNFYVASLLRAQNDIRTGTISAKDKVGKAYECHRARIFEIAGFKVLPQIKHPCVSWNADQAYFVGDTLIALEETKGHFADKCMTIRALHNFAETIVNFKEANLPIPHIIFHSFTRPDALKGQMGFWTKINPELCALMNDKIIVNWIGPHNRLPKTQWWGKKYTGDGECYTTFKNDERVRSDIEFINTLVTQYQ
jgi:hypothetical protein